jgi:nucleotide-binding universal stress UspA family protein
MQRILVATDGSPPSWDAVYLAVDLAREHRVELIFVYVVPTVDLFPEVGFDEPGVALLHLPSAADHAVLEDAASFANARGTRATTALLGGRAAEEIVKHAEAQGVDMIVIGSRGHGAITSALLGSVSLGVLHASTCQVLIVHGAGRLHATSARQRPMDGKHPAG